MANELVAGNRRAMWAIDGTGDSRRLVFGSHAIALADIASVRAEEVRDRPVAGLVLAAVLFVTAAAVIAFGVFEADLRTRFLIATVLLGFFGIVSLIEASAIRRQRIFEVTFGLRSGATARFASADRGEIEAILARLRADA